MITHYAGLTSEWPVSLMTANHDVGIASQIHHLMASIYYVGTTVSSKSAFFAIYIALQILTTVSFPVLLLPLELFHNAPLGLAANIDVPSIPGAGAVEIRAPGPCLSASVDLPKSPDPANGPIPVGQAGPSLCLLLTRTALATWNMQASAVEISVHAGQGG